MAGDHRRATNDHVVLQRNAAGNRRTGSDDAMLANYAVMADLDLIIELAAIANLRVIQSTTVNRRTGTNFNIITNDHSANLGDFDPLPLIRCEAKAVGTNHGARMENALTEAADFTDATGYSREASAE